MQWKYSDKNKRKRLLTDEQLRGLLQAKTTRFQQGKKSTGAALSSANRSPITAGTSPEGALLTSAPAFKFPDESVLIGRLTPQDKPTPPLPIPQLSPLKLSEERVSLLKEQPLAVATTVGGPPAGVDNAGQSKKKADFRKKDGLARDNGDLDGGSGDKPADVTDIQ